MPQITVSNLTFAYEGSYDNVFQDVSFTIDTGWKLGFVGRNGRGKTTFLKLLTGSYDYTGSIQTPAVNFRYFPYEVDGSAVTVEAVRGVFPDLQDWELIRELNLLGLSEEVLYRPFHTLSPGERTKVLLCALFLGENAFPLIDEPTNHLDVRGREVLGEYLKSKRGFILVSHDRALLDSCTDHTLSLNRTSIEVTGGGFSVWLQEKEKCERHEISENERLRKDIKRLKSAAEQSRRWADEVESIKLGKKKAALGNNEERAYVAEQSRRMQQRRKNLERRQQQAIQDKSALLKDVEETEPLKLFPLRYHSERIARFADVSVSYGGREVLSRITFTLNRGDRVALIGPNGSGKTSLIRLFSDTPPDFAGTVEIGSGLTLSLVPQDASFLTGLAEDYAKNRGIDVSLFFAILRKLGFSREQFEKDMCSYSAGQKKKVLIAASLCESAHLYIWDEPLNYIDLQSRMQIEELLLRFAPTMLFVEHDRAFCENIATKTVLL
ncbi:MAG: ribosomal protection-like ABC-F family protein [Christensenellales bacterium]|jgi:lincosamide and streptogramin A transport system ATP-binding/permease protein